MNVYDCPADVDFPGHDFSNFNFEREQQKVRDHEEALRNWLSDAGYVGEHSGKIISFPVADGQARYMVCDSGHDISLVHLPYYDAYSFPYIERLTRDDILAAISRADALERVFSRGQSPSP